MLIKGGSNPSNRIFHQIDWAVQSELQLWLRRKHQCSWRSARKHWNYQFLYKRCRLYQMVGKVSHLPGLRRMPPDEDGRCAPALHYSSTSRVQKWPIQRVAGARLQGKESRPAGDPHRPRRGLAARRTARPRAPGRRGTGPVEDPRRGAQAPRRLVGGDQTGRSPWSGLPKYSPPMPAPADGRPRGGWRDRVESGLRRGEAAPQMGDRASADSLRWNLDLVLDQRGADIADLPGGASGLLVRAATRAREPIGW
jgi:hypothetical protein